MKKFLLGIDEAGRGPVIGPLVLAGCVIDKKSEKILKELGVKDSKSLSQEKREFLKKKIIEISKGYKVIKVSAKEIDQKNKEKMNLNQLETYYFAKIINYLNRFDEKVKVIIDCPSKNINELRKELMSRIKKLSNLEIICEFKADQNHIAVSAASILAKCEREKEIKILNNKYGNIGSGYCSDPKTIKFVEENAIKYSNEDIFRKSWSTWKTAVKKTKQRKISDF